MEISDSASSVGLNEETNRYRIEFISVLVRSGLNRNRSDDGGGGAGTSPPPPPQPLKLVASSSADRDTELGRNAWLATLLTVTALSLDQFLGSQHT